jgi:hypothetical protein
MAAAASNGGGSLIITEVVGDYIEFVADAIYNTYFEMEIEVSYDTNYTVDWGDGVIEEGTLLKKEQRNVTHDFPENSDPKYLLELPLLTQPQLQDLNFIITIKK